MPYQFKRHSNIEEARALLPRLRSTFQCIHCARDRLVGNEQELAALLEKTGGDLGGEKVVVTGLIFSSHLGVSL